MKEKRNMLLAFAGAALVVGFFLPWFSYGPIEVSGWEFVRVSNISFFSKALLVMCPISGLVLFLAALVDGRAASGVGLAVGGGTLAYFGYKFVSITGLGLWLVLAAAIVAVLWGLASRSNSSSK
jgi:hypothetical protein